MLGIGLNARRLLRAAIRRLLQRAAGGLAQWPLGRGMGHVGVEDGACRRRLVVAVRRGGGMFGHRAAPLRLGAPFLK
jgi:hypothetical protein